MSIGLAETPANVTVKTVKTVNNGKLESWSGEQYHSAAGYMSRGRVLLAMQSMRMLKAYDDDKLRVDAPTPAMLLGVVAHIAALEPAKYENEYVVAPAMDRRRVNGLDEYGFYERNGRTIMGKEACIAWDLANEDKITVPGHTHRLASGIAIACMRHKTASRLLTAGQNEQAVTWTCPDTGIWCKSLIDAHYSPETGGCADLKTCHDPSPDGFRRSAMQSKLHVQDAWYTWGESIRLGVPWDDIPPMIFIPVRSKYPHEVTTCVLAQLERAAGLEICKSALRAVAASRASGDWGNPWEAAGQPLELEAWPEYATRNPFGTE